MTLRTEFPGREAIELLSANIGPGGAYCVSPKHFPEMARLEVTLLLPSREGEERSRPMLLKIQSVVVRSEPAGDASFHIALLFSRLTDDERALLGRCLGATAAEAG